MTASDTQARIIGAAEALFYESGLRGVSVDAIAERAGVTKRTLYYHFESKDALIAAYLAARAVPTMQRYRDWLAATEGQLPERIVGLFGALAAYAGQPRWRGCGFTRAAVELADQPGHPALGMARNHKRCLEAWLAGELQAGGVVHAAAIARQLSILLEGTIALMLIHRDTAYAIAAGEAAATLVANGLRAGPASSRHETAGPA